MLYCNPVLLTIHLSVSGWVAMVLCLRLCLRRYRGGAAGWRPGLGRPSLQGDDFAVCSMMLLFLLLIGGCCWKCPLSPATCPCSMTRRDWRLYSSLARRAFLVISSSAALERRTRKDMQVLYYIIRFKSCVAKY